MRYNKKLYNSPNIKILAYGVVIICALTFSNFKASANSILFTYDYAGLQAEFMDVSSGEVQITLAATSATETINALYFNFDPLLPVSSLIFSPVRSTGGSFGNPTIEVGADAFKVAGEGKYDIMFCFQNGIIADGTAVFDISGIPDLTVEDFNFSSTESAGGSGPTASSASFSISPGSSFVILDKETVTVPDGFATAILLGMGMLCLEGMRRSRVAGIGCFVKTSGLEKKG